MERDHDKRARRPPAPESGREGLIIPGESIDGTDGSGLDLRSGQHKFELGRNPRGGPVSVNETIARYKEAQARKFAEHGADNRREAPKADNASAADMTTAHSDAVTGSEVLPDSPSLPEQQLLKDSALAPVPPARGALSHERAPRSKLERQGLLRHSHPTDDPKDILRKRNTQRDSEGYLLPDEVTSTHTIAPAAAGSLGKAPLTATPTADSVIRGAEYDPLRIKTEGKLRFTDDDPVFPADAGFIPESERPDEAPLTDEQPLEEDASPDTKPPARDIPLSHERDSGINHDRLGRLLYDHTPAAPSAPLRHTPAYLTAAAAIAAGGDKTNKDIISDTTVTAPTAVTSGDRRRADDPVNAPIVTDIGGAHTDSDALAPEIGAERGTLADTPAEAAPAADDTTAPADGSVDPSDVDASTESGTAAGDKPPPDTRDFKPARDGRGSDTGSSERKKKNGKLKFEDEADAPDRNKYDRKLSKATQKAGRSSEKLSKARERLPTKRKLRMNREFDAEKGKFKPRLRFEEEVKTSKEHMKGSPVTRPLKFGAGAAIGYAHSKMYQVEDDNVAVKAAHRGEMLAEKGARSIYRYAKNTPYRRVQKLQKRTTKLDIKADYAKALRDNPGLQKNPVARMMQKRRIKKNYAKAARDAQRTGKNTAAALKKTGEAAAKVVAKLKVVLANPKVWLVIGILALVIILLFGMISACSSMFSGIGSSVTAMSYLSEDDADIDDAELYYTEMETDMRLLAANAETDRPGYDEYRYYIDVVGHDPYMLMGYLSAVYQDFTFTDVKPVLDALFAEQYQLTFTPSVEIRYRTETRTGSWTDADGNSHSYSYEVQVPYEWHILTVTLTARTLSDIITPRMDAEQSEHYGLLMQSKGLRQYAASPFAFDWLPYVSSNYGYRVHPITGEKDYHLGIDVALPTGTEIIAVQTGTVTFAGDLGGYGYVVVIEDSGGLVTKYAHCDALFVSTGQTVTVGEPIATVGNTGNSTGPHLHFEVIKNGRYLNPAFFAMTGNY